MGQHRFDDISFWGWEVLGKSKNFEVHMDADSTHISVYFSKSPKNIFWWLDFKYREWSKFVNMLDQSIKKSCKIPSGELIKTKSVTIEKLSNDSFSVSVGNTFVIFERNLLREFYRLLQRANKNILRFKR